MCDDDEPLLTYEEWLHNPGIYCSYGDYRQHVKAVRAMFRRERLEAFEAQLLKKIEAKLQPPLGTYR